MTSKNLQSRGAWDAHDQCNKFKTAARSRDAWFALIFSIPIPQFWEDVFVCSTLSLMEKLQHDDGMLWDTGDTEKKSTDPRIFIFAFHSLWQQLLTILISQDEQNDHKLEEQYSLCDGWNNRQTLTGIVPLKVILKSYKEADMSVYPWGSSGNHITQQPEARESESGQRTDWDKQTIQLEHRSHTGKEKKRANALQFFCYKTPHTRLGPVN